MTFEAALRATEILLALAFVQQSAEHVFGNGAARRLFALRLVLSVVLFSGIAAPWITVALSLHSLALRDVFAFSAYPVSEELRNLAQRPRLLWTASWAVMLFEVLFPLGFADARLLWGALGGAATFHLANACLFGLNRFLWFWIAAYPSILWLQSRLVLGD